MAGWIDQIIRVDRIGIWIGIAMFFDLIVFSELGSIMARVDNDSTDKDSLITTHIDNDPY